MSTGRGRTARHPRLEGREKVTGTARYAVEYPVDGVTYGWAVPSAVVRGRITRIDTTEALASPGVLAVLHHGNAPRLAPTAPSRSCGCCRSRRCTTGGSTSRWWWPPAWRRPGRAPGWSGSTTTPARTAPCSPTTTPACTQPDQVNPSYPTDTAEGDFDAGYAAAPVRVDVTYRTPAYHNNPMEPHATTAQWHDGRLLVHDSNQGASSVRATLAELFGLPPESVRVVTEHVGGGFGSKGTPRPRWCWPRWPPGTSDRPVQAGADPPADCSAPVGYRTPTIQRVRLAADADGRLTAICHDAISQTSTIQEFAEQTAVYTRSMYAAPHRRTTHRLVRLDVPTPFWMRAPGECPGAYALESAMDELAVAVGIDPVELRIRNEPAVDPDQGAPVHQPQPGRLPARGRAAVRLGRP